MFRLPPTLKFLRAAQAQAGFTMIELLVVISILGILAVAVLSAINPVEQINRGRDTGNRSDAEQLISAIDRFYAFQGYAPWKTSPVSPAASDVIVWTQIAANVPVDNTAPNPCPVLDKLSQATAPCVGADELKISFVNRVEATTYNPLFIYNQGLQGNSTYVCFLPKSGAFKQEALNRCTSNSTVTSPLGLPGDIDAATAAIICDTAGSGVAPYICLP